MIIIVKTNINTAMKQRYFFTTFLLILSLFTQNIWAQRPAQTPTSQTTNRKIDTVQNSDFSLNGQYQFMLSRSKTINGFKLINPYRLTGVWKSVTDSLQKNKTAMAKANAQIIAQEKSIEALKTQISEQEIQLTASSNKVDEINFLGMHFTKGTYNMMVWSIILILGLALFIVITRSAKNIMEARHRTELYEEISSEFQQYKSKANEKERKLARELQDERNIVEELKNKGR